MRSIFHFGILLCGLSGSAQIQFDSLHQLLAISSSDSIKQEVLLELSWQYSFSNVDTSEYFARQGIALATERMNQRDLASSKEMLAIIYDIRGSIDESASLYLEVATYYESHHALSELSSTYNNLGTLFFNNDEVEKAGVYFEKSMAIDVSQGDSLGVVASLINLASIANRMGNTRAANQYLMRGKRIVSEISNSWTKRSVYEALANNHFYEKNNDSAVYYYETVIPLSNDAGDTHTELSSMIGLTLTYTSSRNYPKALRIFQRAEIISADHSEAYLTRALYNAGADLFAQMGKFEQAYKYQTHYLAVSDSITKEERIGKINELEQKYQSEQSQKEIAELEIENQKSRNQRNILFLASGLVVLGAAFLIVLLKSKSKSNQVISKSLSEKETLLKEIHHRVKNNLQVISSLLSLQSRYIEDEKAQAAVNEGQNRVKSMALIHQKLYQNNNLLGVEVIDYVKNLTATLKDAYGIDTDRISIDYELDDLKIDVDTIIPIGLILNELISNSFKYAFPDNREGSMRIVLRKLNRELELRVTDDGVGSTKEIEKSNSFGMRMIQSLALKLEARVNFNFEKGADASLLISSFKLV
ncbi:MAG: histidine kinase dimerization/phosphoacceptor domain -containing protein [Cyclobacteriaceae bacterium]